MSIVTNLIGRPASFFKPNTGSEKEGTEYRGFICGVFNQPDPRIAPRVAIETKTGLIVTAPLDAVWLLIDHEGKATALGQQIAAQEQEQPDAGTSSTGS